MRKSQEQIKIYTNNKQQCEQQHKKLKPHQEKEEEKQFFSSSVATKKLCKVKEKQTKERKKGSEKSA